MRKRRNIPTVPCDFYEDTENKDKIKVGIADSAERVVWTVIMRTTKSINYFFVAFSFF